MSPEAAALLAHRALYAVLEVVGAYILLLSMLLLWAMRRAGALLARRAASAEVRPTLHSALVDFLAGATDDTLFRQHVKADPEDMADALLLFQTTVSGSARDRLCNLALDLGLVHDWCEAARARDAIRRRAAFAGLAFVCVYEPCRRVAADLMLERLDDADEDVRLSACRGVLLAIGEDQLQEVFALAIQRDTLTRIVLTEDLRRHALALAAGPVREVLRSGDAPSVRATMEIVAAWERAIPLEDLGGLLEHSDREIRALAFQLAAYVTVDRMGRKALLRSLRDADSGIRGLAIVAVGRQKMTDAIPDLAYCLRVEGLEEARQAATALAGMPPLGWSALEELSANANPVTALAAHEALARVRGEVK